MVSKAKLYSRLDDLEDELQERIVPHLEKAVDGRNDLVFCATDFNKDPELKSKTDNTTDELIQVGRQILTLREKLGEPSDGSIAERICFYCRKWSDSPDCHKHSVAELAQSFLKEIITVH